MRMKRIWTMVMALGLLTAGTACTQNTKPAELNPHPDGDGIISRTFVPTASEAQQLTFLQQPPSWFAANLKGSPEISQGETLNPKIQYVLENVTRPNTNPTSQAIFRTMALTPQGRQTSRTALDRYWLVRTTPVDTAVMSAGLFIKGRDGEIPVRIYRPKGEANTILPVLVYYHGGGFMFGSLDSFEPLAMRLASDAKMVVVSVGYGLTPQHPYPSAHNEAQDAYLWTLANIGPYFGDSGNVSLGGDSSGGNLALSVALRQLKAKSTTPRSLLLFYPGVDANTDYASQKEFASGYGLDKTNLEYLAGLLYPKDAILNSADVSPITADLCGLAPLIMVTGGFDPLRDQNRAFSAKAAAAGVNVEALHYPSLIHGFLQMSAYVDEADAATKTSGEMLGALVRSDKKANASCKPA